MMINSCYEHLDCELPEEALAQLEQLDRAQGLMQYIIAGIFIRYQLFNVQREQLLNAICTPDCEQAFPDTFQMETVSSLLILYALCGFFAQSQQLTAEAEPCSAGRCSLEQDSLLTAIVILIAIIRFFKLMKQPEANQTLQTPQEEVLDFPL